MLKPLGNRVILKQLKVEETTKSGILLPTTAKEKSGMYEVVAVGDGKLVDSKIEEMIVKVGDKVVCSEYCGTQVKYQDVDYKIVRQDDILAVVE
mgnify:FL=1